MFDSASESNPPLASVQPAGRWRDIAARSGAARRVPVMLQVSICYTSGLLQVTSSTGMRVAMRRPVLETRLDDLPVRRGKVRDIYDLGSELLLVSTDRISAFDWILPDRHSRQGPRADADQRASGSTGWASPITCSTTDVDAMDLPAGRRPRAAGRPQHARAQDRGRADRVRRARLPVRLGLEGISTAGDACAASGCRRD